MTAATLMLVHGWGFDASVWTGLAARMPERSFLSLDLGFLGAPARPAPTGESPVVAIGHSTGLLWLLHERPFVWDALISINGFPRFVSGDGYAPAVEPRVLDRMLSRFDRDPHAVTADFLHRCGHAAPPAVLNVPALREGLEWLRRWDARDSLARERSPLLALAGEADPIVPPPMTRAAFEGRGRVRWSGTGGHLLPLSDPDWCAREIRAFLTERAL
ncbi:MAG: alpha/beta hydrolase [Alphaproteobacteria bacterium]|nr:alpha/beta hydrolase [Alphaproteobacteria bacterium]